MHNKKTTLTIPYEDYNALMKNKKIDLKHTVPSEVVDFIFDKGYSPARAWREHLDKTQDEVAQAMGVSQAAYSAFERSGKPRKATRQKIAKALGITFEQLDI